MSPHGRVPFHEPRDAAADGWFAPLLGPHLPTGFSRRVTVLHPDEHYPLDAPQWRRSLILVTHGLVEITTASGDHDQRRGHRRRPRLPLADTDRQPAR